MGTLLPTFLLLLHRGLLRVSWCSRTCLLRRPAPGWGRAWWPCRWPRTGAPRWGAAPFSCIALPGRGDPVPLGRASSYLSLLQQPGGETNVEVSLISELLMYSKDCGKTIITSGNTCRDNAEAFMRWYSHSFMKATIKIKSQAHQSTQTHLCALSHWSAFESRGEVFNNVLKLAI